MSAPNFSNSNPVRNDFLVFGSPKIEQEEIDEVVECLKSGWIGTGPRVNKFENAFVIISALNMQSR